MIKKYTILVLIFLLAVAYSSQSQIPSAIRKDSTTYKKLIESKIDKSKIPEKTLTLDSLSKTKIDSVQKDSKKALRKSKSDVDSIVNFTAKDSVVFNAKTRMMKLRGNVKLHYKDMNSSAEIIYFDFNNSLMHLESYKDTSKKYIGVPKILDKGEEYVGEKILYNFKTRQGTITLGETELSEGYYFGKKIKRVSESELFIQDGCYTTCNKPHPHFYFGSPEMKVVAKDRVFIDPLIFYVEDLPVFILPFGLFFPSKGGRQSGVLVPTFAFSKSRGVVFQDFGYYFALSDYYDTQFKGDFFSKGGYTFKNTTRWKIRDVLDGNLSLEYGKTRYNPDDNYTTNYKLAFRHNQEIVPGTRFDASMSFLSQDFNRNTSLNLNDRLKQDITSNASLSKTFDNGQSLSLSFNRNQNIITNEVRQTLPQLSYSIPQLYPLKSIIPPQSFLPDWVRDLSFQYSVSSSYYTEHIMKFSTVPVTDSTTRIDTSFTNNFKTAINHSPRISISPKFGYFTVSPYISLSANNYFRRIDRQFNPVDSGYSETVTHGLFWEYWYSYGISVSTRVFGVVKPKIFGINALRHILQPTISYNITPDFSGAGKGLYGSYYNEKTKMNILYSRYELDGGGGAPRALSKSIGYTVNNSFQAKIAQPDTLPEKNLDFLQWTFNGNYNYAADSLKFSDIGMSFRIPTLSDINMTASTNFTLYDQERSFDQTNQVWLDSYHKVDKLLLSQGKGLMRLTDLNLQFSTTFNSSGVSFNPELGKDVEGKKKDSVGLGERFSERQEDDEKPFDFFGENNPGFTPLNIPWTINLSLNYQYSQPFVNQITRRINFNTVMNFKLTKTWSIDANAQYDFVAMQLIAPSITVKKDMHCWDLLFQWYPIGYNQGFYLKFAIKAPQLQDLKIEKRNNPLLR